MQVDREQHCRDAAAAVAARRQYAREARKVEINQEQVVGLLTEMRDRAEAIRTDWANPQYGTNITEETDRLIEAFEKLDKALTAKCVLPSDWTDGEG